MVCKTGAGLARHRSAQDVQTPANFIEAVERRFGRIHLDLAATEENAQADLRWGPGSKVPDSLVEDWTKREGLLWLNPPYGDIEPWARKCATCRDRSGWLLFLVPASVGANWFHEHVVPNSHVLELRDRLTFVGSSQPYPKDLLLSCFGFGMTGRSAWHWDTSKRKQSDRRLPDLV
jgi:phage N-6-adenine-methyltransferase